MPNIITRYISLLLIGSSQIGCLPWDDQLESATQSDAAQSRDSVTTEDQRNWLAQTCIDASGSCQATDAPCTGETGKCREFDFETELDQSGDQHWGRFWCAYTTPVSSCRDFAGPSEESPGSANHVFRAEVPSPGKMMWSRQIGWTINGSPETGTIRPFERIEVGFDFWAPEPLESGPMTWLSINTSVTNSMQLRVSSTGSNTQAAVGPNLSELAPGPLPAKRTRVQLVIQRQDEQTCSLHVSYDDVKISMPSVPLPSYVPERDTAVQYDGYLGIDFPRGGGTATSALYDSFIYSVTYSTSSDDH